MTAAVVRPVFADTPSTPHRVDAYSVLQSQHLTEIPTASLREQVVRSFGQAVSSEFEIPEGHVEKISKYESPENVVKKSNAKLLEAGFTQPEIKALFAASLRTNMNNAAHQMKLGVAASLLAGMDIDPIEKEAVKKAFHYVSGFEIDQVDPKSKDILTTSGVSSGHTDSYLFAGGERWAEVGTWD
ncbi:hypothetical protein Egran_01518 [Elaphomyces granulatus]|uniref:Uncharacterized protein n=1 Tax=Elaphomyces granulatus TaxID=519963 RepID=A0A232M2S7_9EURO|nr:hypothetical protein Egran_01518 [Elaphomyces granulatus]